MNTPPTFAPERTSDEQAAMVWARDGRTASVLAAMVERRDAEISHLRAKLLTAEGRVRTLDMVVAGMAETIADTGCPATSYDEAAEFVRKAMSQHGVRL